MPKMKDVSPSVCGWSCVHHRSDRQIVDIVAKNALFEMVVLAVCVQAIETPVLDGCHKTKAATVIVTQMKLGVKSIVYGPIGRKYPRWTELLHTVGVVYNCVDEKVGVAKVLRRRIFHDIKRICARN